MNWPEIIPIFAGPGIHEALYKTGAMGASRKLILKAFEPIDEIGLLFGI